MRNGWAGNSSCNASTPGSGENDWIPFVAGTLVTKSGWLVGAGLPGGGRRRGYSQNRSPSAPNTLSVDRLTKMRLADHAQVNASSAGGGAHRVGMLDELSEFVFNKATLRVGNIKTEQS
jgi:hypothetical protein